MSDLLTALERAVIELVAVEHWVGFRADGLQVLKRENTGVGRYTYVVDALQQSLPDGSFSAQGRMIEVEGVPNGLGFVVDVSSSRIDYIEFFTFGNNEWDGVERSWRIV